MLRFCDIRGKKANSVRWEALKLLDWEKDLDAIKMIAEITNGRFFSSRTPEQVVDKIREDIEEEKRFLAYYDRTHSA